MTDSIEFDEGVWSRGHDAADLGVPGALLWYRENPLDPEDGGFYAQVVAYEREFFADFDDYADWDPSGERGVGFVIYDTTAGRKRPEPRYLMEVGDPIIIADDEPWLRVA